MFVAMLSNLRLHLKAQSGSSFADVPGDAWYANAAAWAAENDLVEGKGGTSFDGEGEVDPRADRGVLDALCRLPGPHTSARTDVDFPDADEVSEWAREAMSWAVAEGLFTGNGVTGELDPPPVPPAPRRLRCSCASSTRCTHRFSDIRALLATLIFMDAAW